MAIDADAAARATFIPQRGVSPFMVAGAQGNYLVAADGRRILDAGGGAIVVNIGHGREEVAEAAARGLREVTYAIPPFATEARIRLVERLTSNWLPRGLTRVGFTSGGSSPWMPPSGWPALTTSPRAVMGAGKS